MKVYIHQLGYNKDFDFDCDSSRVIDIKHKILDTKGIPIDIQSLYASSLNHNDSTMTYPSASPLADNLIVPTDPDGSNTVHLDLFIHLAGGCGVGCNILGYPCGIEVCTIQ